jgi:hypothetical protein
MDVIRFEKKPFLALPEEASGHTYDQVASRLKSVKDQAF